MIVSRICATFAAILTCALLISGCAAATPSPPIDQTESAPSNTPSLSPTLSLIDGRATEDAAYPLTVEAKRTDYPATISAQQTARAVQQEGTAATATAHADAVATGLVNAALITEEDIPEISVAAWGDLYFFGRPIEEVQECFAEEAALKRYPETLTVDELPSIYAPQTPCDWALLADAYARRSLSRDFDSQSNVTLNPIPVYGRYAFAQAVSVNPAYAMGSGGIFVAYLDEAEFIEPPPLNGDIVSLEYHYSLGSQSGSVDETLLIIQAGTNPIAHSTMFGRDEFADVNNLIRTRYPSVDSVQRLKATIRDLLPIENDPTFTNIRGPVCGEFGMWWDARLTFTDGTTVTAKSAISFILAGGGPTLMEFDFQDRDEWTYLPYIQHSSDFLRALTALVVEIAPESDAGKWGNIGSPACGWEYLDLPNQAFGSFD